jgi:hypothetical protein
MYEIHENGVGRIVDSKFCPDHIPSVTRTFTGKNMLWRITYIF